MCPQRVSSCVCPQKVRHVLILTQNAVLMLSRAFAHSSYVSRWIDVERCPVCVYLSRVSPRRHVILLYRRMTRMLILSSYVPVHSVYVTLSARCIIVCPSHLFVFSPTDCMSPPNIHTEWSTYGASWSFFPQRVWTLVALIQKDVLMVSPCVIGQRK